MDEKHISFLSNKAVEAFLMCIEIYNKPTINYRLEGCVFFLCNAWELMLKAKLLKDGKAIYYPHSDRTLSLKDCAAKILTNKKDPVRINLDVIISLRNTTTHDILPEYELVYLPFLTFCVKNFVEKLYIFLNININDYIKSDFLALFTNNKSIDNNQILSSYGEYMAKIFDKKISFLNSILEANPNSSIALNVQVNITRINNKSKADFTFYSGNNPNDQNIKFINRLINPNDSHVLTFHGIVNKVDEIIKKDGLKFTPIREPIPSSKNPNPNIFTSACLDELIKKFDFKNNEEYCLKIVNGNTVIYKYSPLLITKIISLILEDPDIIIKLRQKN